MKDEFIPDIKSQDKLRLTRLQMTQDDSVQMKKKQGGAHIDDIAKNLSLDCTSHKKLAHTFGALFEIRIRFLSRMSTPAEKRKTTVCQS